MPLETSTDLMTDAAREIFETMFFLAAEDCAPAADWIGSVGAEVEFNGAESGRFEVQLDPQLAQELAAGFSGVMDPSEMPDDAVPQVVCELANMICGATLSRMEPDALFNLEPPRLIAAPGSSEEDGQLVRWLDSGQGLIRLSLAWA
jgi:CheY-specific phosphatase CheX